ncbi:hypothetical protein CYMTET_20119 [Cymbomonas tetramitiformis]|uniref:Uncharacterized protein n=1 Tax=Cymbomonas tetramitiformis TaxID=36881 RepID=A0AAE0G564_9CHLO|nr:hypothetical protein CYMTET_20119 [Cymbomonas tetramitiformis]
MGYHDGANKAQRADSGTEGNGSFALATEEEAGESKRLHMATVHRTAMELADGCNIRLLRSEFKFLPPSRPSGEQAQAGQCRESALAWSDAKLVMKLFQEKGRNHQTAKKEEEDPWVGGEPVEAQGALEALEACCMA